MMLPSTVRLVSRRFGKSLRRFRDDESGTMAVFVLIMFMLMITFGGIAVDVMRFEARRVAMQQTMDRAVLAAANLNQARTPKAITEDWFNKAGLGDDLAMVTFTTPTVVAIADAGLRRVTLSARVRSNNFFMGLLNVDYLEGPTLSEAAQGVSQIEVMLVLDITGSMNETIGVGTTKIAALRNAATEFVSIVKKNDKKNGVSIGMVPYAANVNIPVALRNQLNVKNVSSWNGIANAGVPNINCVEIPISTFGAVGLSPTLAMPMMAVADTNSGTTTTTDHLAASANLPVATSRACTTAVDDTKTAFNEELINLLLMPSKNVNPLNLAISRLYAAGNTSIAVGMRWGTALIDDDARPIYTAIGDSTVQGRPADNSSVLTRKIIILMTDGSHVTNNHVKDAYKSGPSPIWRGSDGNFAIRFWSAGTDLHDNKRPDCALSNEYFIPHLKPAWFDTNNNGVRNTSNPNEVGACAPTAWSNKAEWKGGDGKTITGVRLDWSEVWRYVKVSYVARQFYMRSNVTDATNYNTNMNLLRQTYLTSPGFMDTLLQQNCTAAKDSGIEIYGIAFAAPTEGQFQINGCSSAPKENYYYNATDNAKLLAAFQQIATDISELRLTQ